MPTLAGSNHILCYVNPAFCRLLSKTKDELTGKPFAEAMGAMPCIAEPRIQYRGIRNPDGAGTDRSSSR